MFDRVVNYTVEEKVNLHGVESRLDEINSTIKDGQQTIEITYDIYDKLSLSKRFYEKPDKFTFSPHDECLDNENNLLYDIRHNGGDLMSTDIFEAFKYYDCMKLARMFMRIYKRINEHIHQPSELDSSKVTIPISEYNDMLPYMFRFNKDELVKRFTGKSKLELFNDFEDWINDKLYSHFDDEHVRNYMIKNGVKFYGREEVLKKFENE